MILVHLRHDALDSLVGNVTGKKRNLFSVAELVFPPPTPAIQAVFAFQKLLHHLQRKALKKVFFSKYSREKMLPQPISHTDLTNLLMVGASSSICSTSTSNPLLKGLSEKAQMSLLGEPLRTKLVAYREDLPVGSGGIIPPHYPDHCHQCSSSKAMHLTNL